MSLPSCALALPHPRFHPRSSPDPSSAGAAAAASCCLRHKLAAAAAPTRTGACIYDINLISLTCPMGDTKRPVMKENPIRSLPGIPVLLGVLVVAAAAAWLFFHGVGATGGEPARSDAHTSALQ